MLAVSVLAKCSPNSQSVLLKLVSVVHYNSLHNNRFIESVESHCIVMGYSRKNTHTPDRWQILAGGGVDSSGNSGGRGDLNRKILTRGSLNFNLDRYILTT